MSLIFHLGYRRLEFYHLGAWTKSLSSNNHSLQFQPALSDEWPASFGPGPLSMVPDQFPREAASSSSPSLTVHPLHSSVHKLTLHG